MRPLTKQRRISVRKVIAGLFISIEGVIQAPNQWQFDNFDNEMMAAMGAHIAREDTILLGRVTYQEWASYWPTSTDEPYASHINNTSKYVVSTTLDQVEWKNSTLILPAVLFCFIFLYIAARGGGAWSLDTLLRRRRGSGTNAEPDVVPLSEAL